MRNRRRRLGMSGLLLAALLAASAGAEEQAAGAMEPAAEGPSGSEPATGDEAPADAPGDAPAETADKGGYTFPPEVEALLNQASDPGSYAQTERCLNTRDIRGTEILDDRHLVFETSGKRFYLVQFPYSCPGLRRGASLVYETRMNRLCQLDQIRAFEPGPAIPNPPCTLPGFMPVEKEQVTLLRESLKAQRKAELDAYKAEKQRKKAEKAASEQEEQGEQG